MREAALLWWRGLSDRERQLLTAMAALALLILAWLLLIRPLSQAQAAARERHGEAITMLAETRSQAEAFRRRRSESVAPLAAPLDSLVSRSAAEAGFPVSAVTQAGSGRVSLSLAAVRPQAFFGWTAQLEAAGVEVDRLAVTTNSDRTLAVEVTFRGRGS